MNGFTLNILLWGYLIAYCIHIVEESTVGGGFVQMMKRDYWPEYDARKFFWFNTMLLSLLALGLVLYDLLGNGWLICPLSFGFLFVTNGLWHLLQTAILHEYSPGLITSPIYWVLMYFIFRFNQASGEISPSIWLVSIVIGVFMTLLMYGSALLMRWKSLRAEEM
jgi:hypothetical protein